MPDRRTRQGVLSALSVTLLMVVGAAAANDDLRLVNAVKDQDPQQVRTLAERHPDVNVRSEDGSTALLWAAHWNDLQTAELLVRAGADANAANDFRMTPLSQACTNGSAGFVDLLLKAGANPNTADRNGRDAVDDVREGRQRRRRSHAARSRRRCERQRAEPESNRVDVGRRATTSEGAPDAHRGAGGSPGAHQIWIYRAALCRARGRHGVDADAAWRRRRREHQIAARS